MLLLSSVMLLARALVLVLLGLVSQGIALLYIGLDVGLYLIVKILRDDFYYWAPVNGLLGLFLSFLCRVIGKVIIDFTNSGEIISYIKAFPSSRIQIFLTPFIYFFQLNLGTQMKLEGPIGLAACALC